MSEYLSSDSRFSSIPYIKGKLEENRIQSAIDWWGDPVRHFLDQSFENEIVRTYEEGLRIHSLIRVANYITAAILKMLAVKDPDLIYSLSDEAERTKKEGKPIFISLGTAVGFDMQIFEDISRTGLKKLIDVFGNEFRDDVPASRSIDDMAETGIEALEKLWVRYCDLVIINMKLPDMTGEELQTKVNKVMPHMKTTILGMVPISPENLVTIVDDLLKKTQQ